jgi:hypothetical protein
MACRGTALLYFFRKLNVFFRNVCVRFVRNPVFVTICWATKEHVSGTGYIIRLISEFIYSYLIERFVLGAKQCIIRF